MPSLSLTSKLAEKMAEVDSRGGFLNKAGARIGTLLALPTALIDVAGHVCTAALKIIPAIPGTIANGVAHLLHKHGKIEKKWSTEWSIGGLLKNLCQAVKHIGVMFLAPLVGVVSPKSMFKGFFPVQAKLAEVAKRENEFSLALQANRDATKSEKQFDNLLQGDYAEEPEVKAPRVQKNRFAEWDAAIVKIDADQEFDTLLQGDYAEEPEVKAPRVQKNLFAEWDTAIAKIDAEKATAAAEKATLALAAKSPLPADDDDFDSPEVKTAAEKAKVEAPVTSESSDSEFASFSDSASSSKAAPPAEEPKSFLGNLWDALRS